MNSKIMITIGLFFAFIFLVSAYFITFTENNAENVQVIQGWPSGKLSLRVDAGTYYKGLDRITTYRRADVVEPKNNCEMEGNVYDGYPSQFRDGADGCIPVSVKVRYPLTPKEFIFLHREAPNQKVLREMVRSAIATAVYQSAGLFGAEETYSTRRAELQNLIKEQLEKGIFKTVSKGQTNEIVRDDDGNPIVQKESVLDQYGIEIITVEMGDIEFDSETDTLIQLRKQKEQEETVARADAAKAVQDAITAEERGKANLAREKYAALVVKEKAVIDAQRETAIQEEKTLQALEDAKQRKAKGDAEAYANKLKVEAGITPQEEMEYLIKIAEVVSSNIKESPVPSVMIMGGEDGGTGAENALKMVGAERAFRLYQNLSNIENYKK